MSRICIFEVEGVLLDRGFSNFLISRTHNYYGPLARDHIYISGVWLLNVFSWQILAQFETLFDIYQGV